VNEIIIIGGFRAQFIYYRLIVSRRYYKYLGKNEMTRWMNNKETGRTSGNVYARDARNTTLPLKYNNQKAGELDASKKDQMTMRVNG
jgi:hypothetical protein